LYPTQPTETPPPAPPIVARADQGDAKILDDVRAAIGRFVVLPSEAASIAVPLWIAATHAQRVATHATRLAVLSPEKRCGKTRLLDILAVLSRAPLISANASTAAIFRSIDEDDPPTLLLDEADSIFGKRADDAGVQDLRGLLNAGFGRDRPSLRCIGAKQVPTPFPTFAMAALAAIGDLPDTILDRSVIVRMRRRSPGERVDPFRARRDKPPLHALRDRLAAWIEANLDALRDADPLLPLEDRAADAWEPLIAVADLAGGAWPDRARTAAVFLANEADAAASELSLGLRLLADLRTIFGDLGTTEASSAALVDHLRALSESPWGAFDFTAAKLAHRLRPYGVSPLPLRPGGASGPQVRGYRLSDLADVFARYLPAVPPSQTVTPSHSQVGPVTPSGAVTVQTVTRGESVTGLTRDCDAVTPCDTPVRGPKTPQETLADAFGPFVEQSE